MIYVYIAILVLFSALFSGLTLGLLGLDPFELKRKMDLGDKFAAKVYPLRKRGNLLLTTLLLGNVAVNSAISIMLADISTGVIAGLVATGLIFIFGEVIPQAVISRFPLQFGAATSPLVRLVMFVAFPISYPIAFVLDKALGRELPSVFSRKELMSIVAEHEDSPHSTLDADEERIIHGALEFSNKTAEEVMTPRTVLYALDESTEITAALLEEIRDKGFSRIPTYEETNESITGYFHVRDLLGVSKGVIKDVVDHDILSFSEEIKLDALFNIMLKKRQHIAILNGKFGELAGLVTLEDILEEVIGREIVDEDDVHEDMREFATEKKKGIK